MAAVSTGFTASKQNQKKFGVSKTLPNIAALSSKILASI
jgi:hypothetical protein